MKPTCGLNTVFECVEEFLRPQELQVSSVI